MLNLLCRYASTLNCDEEVINETFKEDNERHKVEKPAFRGKSTEDAIRIMNNKKCDALKRLNRQKYRTEEKRRQLQQAHNSLEEFEQDQKQVSWGGGGTFLEHQSNCTPQNTSLNR